MGKVKPVEMFLIYLPEQFHDVINMSPFTEHLHDVVDKKRSIANAPVRSDTCGDESVVS